MTELKELKALLKKLNKEGGEAEAGKSWWKNKKTQGVYRVEGVALDCTNANDGTVMVMYKKWGKGQCFVREYEEFREKFEAVFPVRIVATSLHSPTTTKTFCCVEECAEVLQVPAARVKLCAETGQKWKGWVFDEWI